VADGSSAAVGVPHSRSAVVVVGQFAALGAPVSGNPAVGETSVALGELASEELAAVQSSVASECSAAG
jgi:hypothetical protein